MKWLAMAGSFVVGGASVAQSRINSDLGALLGDGIFAAWISFTLGLLVVGLVFLLVPTQRAALGRLRVALRRGDDGRRSIQPWQLFGGLGGATFVAAQSITVQFLGIAIFTVAVVTAQNSNSLVVDRVGLGPAGVQPFTLRRIVGAAIAIVGVVIAVSSQTGAANFALWALIFALIAGALIAIQQAINGRVAKQSGSPWAAGLGNFTVGWLGLSVALVISHVASPHDWAPPPSLFAHPLLWVGGLIGVAFIVIAAWAVPRLGVLIFALLSIAGQVFGALYFEVVLPEPGQSFSWLLVVGVVVTGAAVALAATGTTQARRA